MRKQHFALTAERGTEVLIKIFLFCGGVLIGALFMALMVAASDADDLSEEFWKDDDRN